MSECKIVIIMSGFPRRSETFALNELLALDAQGLLAGIFAAKQGDGSSLHPDSQKILDRVKYLPPGTPTEQAAFVVECLKDQALTGIHGYFAHTPAEVALLAAKQLGVPYGFSTHALDARKVPSHQLAERVLNAACVIACNHDVARELSDKGGTVTLIPHGVDTKRFSASPLVLSEPVHLLAVGRLVEKKGFDVLIKAVGQLPFPFHLKIIGEGPERERLTQDIASANLSAHIELCSGMTHAELPSEYQNAHLVVVPSIVNRAGDRDGLPNVVLEAMASGRPVIASDVGAIKTAVVGGETGVLVPQGDAAALAIAIKSLLERPELCENMGRGARQRIEDDFELGYCTERLCRFLKVTYSY